MVAATAQEARDVGERMTEAPGLVLVHAPWCHFCTRLRPAWEDASNSARLGGLNVVEIELGVVGDLDDGALRSIRDANGGRNVTSVPSIFFVTRRGDLVPYDHTTIPATDYEMPPFEAPRSGLHILRFARDRLLHEMEEDPSSREGTATQERDRNEERERERRKAGQLRPPKDKKGKKEKEAAAKADEPCDGQADSPRVRRSLRRGRRAESP